ncbi:winged helix-turn-helix transcriptional regulator [Methanosarcina siciliae]|uniref:winged helix-turn-helix transcriptional regulator n=1 Tax=Methanosarcina siciliae TaxID=38027 RepID=UPI00064FBF6A
MEPRTTHLVLHYINYRRLYLLCFFSLFIILTAEATEYIVLPAPGDEFGVSVAGEDVQIVEDTIEPYWHFLLWLAIMNILSVVDILVLPAKFLFAIIGFRIVDKRNVLDNPSRDNIYAYIKTNPGTCFSDVVKSTDLNKGTVRYHIQVLESQNKIESYKDGGKIRYFQNNSMYNEKEKKVLVTFQSTMKQRIVLEILNGKCNTNVALTRKIGISKGTVSQHMKNLKDTGLIEEIMRGRGIIYRINNSYKNIVERYR